MSVLLSTQRHAAFRNSRFQKLQQTILKLRRCPHSVAATSQLCLLSRKSLSSIETLSLPALWLSGPGHFDLPVCPSMSQACPAAPFSLLPSLLYLPCLPRRSVGEGGPLIPFAPFGDVMTKRTNVRNSRMSVFCSRRSVSDERASRRSAADRESRCRS